MRMTRDVFLGMRLIDHVAVSSLYLNHSVFGLSCFSGDLPLKIAVVCDVDGLSLLGVISAGSSSVSNRFFSFFVVLTSLGGLVGVEAG